MKKDAFTADVLDPNRHGNLPAVDQAVLAYCGKLTLTPSAMEEADVAALREAGLSDQAILEVCQITGYFNFVNRMADGLGVQLENGQEPHRDVREQFK